MPLYRPVHRRPVELMCKEGEESIEKLLERISENLMTNGCVAIGKDLMIGSFDESLQGIDPFVNPEEFVKNCIKSEKLSAYLEGNVANVEESKRMLLTTQKLDSNPVQGLLFSGSPTQQWAARAVGEEGFLACLQIYAESGLHDVPMEDLAKECTQVFTNETTIWGKSNQRCNLHSDSRAISVGIYQKAWNELATKRGWRLKKSKIPAGQMQGQLNMGGEVDPTKGNWFGVLDPHYRPSEMWNPWRPVDCDIPPPKRQKTGNATSHWRKLNEMVGEGWVKDIENNCVHYYSPHPRGTAFLWTALHPGPNVDDDVVKAALGKGVHGGFAPVVDMKPAEMRPRFAAILGGQTLPTDALLKGELLDHVVRAVWEMAEGCGGCHTFLAKANRPPGFANGRAAGQFKDSMPQDDVRWLRHLRVADATLPGPEGGFRTGKPMPFALWRESHQNTVSNYIRTLLIPEGTPQNIANALPVCIRRISTKRLL